MKLKIRVSRKGPQSLTRQIADQLGSLIETGVLAAGSMLPSERSLAESVGVARNVVRGSYEYLTSGGHIKSEGRKGKRVLAKAPAKKSGQPSGSGKKSAGGRKAAKRKSVSNSGRRSAK